MRVFHRQQAANAESAAFLKRYFAHRNTQGEADTPLADEVRQRVEQARENFKHILALGEVSGCAADASTAEMSAADKYSHRLNNNRNSAAASRVYREVLQRETDYALHDAARRADQY